MEGVLVCDSSMESEHVRPLPLTKEEIMKLNNLSVTFEQARSMFDVDLPTFKAKLMELNIFVWNEPNGLRVRIHGGDYKITMFIKRLYARYLLWMALLGFLMLSLRLSMLLGCLVNVTN